MTFQDWRNRIRIGGAAAALALCNVSASASEVSFSGDILPILSDRCFQCHGPDGHSRKAGLRLDLEDAAKSPLEGAYPIDPQSPETSEVWRRVNAKNPDDLMPPPDEGLDPLSAEERSKIKSWIEAGAPWGKHWAFEKPSKPNPPIRDVHPIDAFVLARIEDSQLSPSDLAPARTRVRRLSMDLTGLPPDYEEVEAFARAPTQENWERLVDKKLASQAFGERMATWWLDAARYSDTDGYQQDATRENWPWRDWVIDAFNHNKPFDAFTIEQFAGDLLDDATPETRLATTFHRNHLTNGEGGRDPEESRIDYVIDRVNTTGTVWLGLTLGCAQCHDHKFDPVSSEDYYRMFAFFNSVDEDGRAGSGAKPFMDYTSPYANGALQRAQSHLEAQEANLDRARAAANARFETWLDEQINESNRGFEPWEPLSPTRLRAAEGTTLTASEDATIRASGSNPRQDDYWVEAKPTNPNLSGLRLEVFADPNHTDGAYSRGETGAFILTDVKLFLRKEGDSRLQELEFESAIADVELDAKGRNYGRVRDTLDDDPRNGWTTEPDRKNRVAVFALANPRILAPDESIAFVLLHRSTRGDANIGRFRISTTDQPKTVLKSLEPMPLERLAAAETTTAEALDPNLRNALRNQFLGVDHEWRLALNARDRAQSQVDAYRKSAEVAKVMVLKERDTPRESHILERGVWNAQGKVVSPGVLESIYANPNTNPKTRLDLAKWLVDPNNPLTARVVVNHIWGLVFGEGLVRTPEDFGLQGEAPTHPEALDWLAVSLIESDWDIKRLIKTMVLSQTYQRDSRIHPEALRLDPNNRLWTRASRHRLPSWMIRDASLKLAGNLNPAIGGPTTFPYQPEGVWNEMFMGRFTYNPSVGAAQYRRTLYAFWRRSSAPTFLFDAAKRRVCEVRPRRTNTPLHALTLLNDTTILESALRIAHQLTARPQDSMDRVTTLYRQILLRDPKAAERQIVTDTWEATRKRFERTPEKARSLLAQGQTDFRDTPNPAQLAAAMMMAQMILNLDETITRE